MHKTKTSNKFAILGLLIVACVLPLFTGRTNNYMNNIYISFCYYAILSSSLNLLLGYTGLISLGHAAFMAIGAYSYAIFSKTLGIHFFPAMIMAVAFTFVCGLIVGITSCKLNAIYLAMATSTFAKALTVFIKNERKLTGGANGFSGIAKWEVFGITFKSFEFYYVSIALCLLVFLVCYRLVYSKTGRAFQALKTAPLAASAMGVNVNGYKLLVNGIAAAMAALAGVIYAVSNGYISADMFEKFSAKLLTMVIIGGIGNLWGPLFGAIFIAGLPELMRGASNHLDGVYGIALLLCVLYMPQGIFGMIRMLADKLMRNRADSTLKNIRGEV